MNRIKQLAALCVLGLPIAALAGGSSSGTITSLFVDAANSNVVYVTLSGIKTGNPPCSSSTKGQFVLPITAANDYSYMFTLATTAAESGTTVTITGQNQCNIDNNVETIQNIKIG